MGALTKGLTFPFLLLAIATTLVYMGGLAALQVGLRGQRRNPRALVASLARPRAAAALYVGSALGRPG